jgi:streptomycin 6-kinase
MAASSQNANLKEQVCEERVVQEIARTGLSALGKQALEKLVARIHRPKNPNPDRIGARRLTRYPSLRAAAGA